MSGYDRRAPESAMGTKLVIYWLIAGVPLLWGVWHTLAEATKLF